MQQKQAPSSVYFWIVIKSEKVTQEVELLKHQVFSCQGACTLSM